MKIAISGKSGCGNSSTSEIVARKLGLHLINYTFRDYAVDQNIGLEEMRRRARIDPNIDRYIDTHQVALAQKGNCVVASRLAIWLVKDADFLVYLSANLLVRSKRISNREQTNYLKTIYHTGMRDRDDAHRYKKKYNINTKNYTFVDLIVNTRTHSIEETSKLIIAGIRKKG